MWHATPSSLRGTLYSYTVIHRPVPPGFDTPYLVGLAEMEGDWRFLARLESADTPPRLGHPLEVRFDHVDDELVLPYLVLRLGGDSCG
jgi:uncharacterized OB-fold protein